MHSFSYEALAFHLADSQTLRVFCRFGITDKIPKRTALAQNSKRINGSTLEQVNRILLGAAKSAGVERGHKADRDEKVERSTPAAIPRRTQSATDSDLQHPRRVQLRSTAVVF